MSLYQSVSQDKEENICNTTFGLTDDELTVLPEKNTNHNTLTDRVTLTVSEDQMMTIIKLLFCIHKSDK